MSVGTRPDEDRTTALPPDRGTAPAPRGRRARHPMRTEFLRGFAPWAGAALLVALAWPLAATAAQWQGSWGGTTTRLGDAAGLVGAPFALAAGAWQGGRERRLGTAELRTSGARGPLAQLLTAALPLGCWLAAAYLLTAAGALAACAPYTSAGHPAPTVVAGTAVSIAACTLLGHVAGRALPWRLTAPALAICGYVLCGVLGTSRSGLRLLALAQVRGHGDRAVPVWWYPLLAALWACGLAAAAVLVVTARRRPAALLPLAAALGAAVLLVRTGDGVLPDNPRFHRQVCDTSTTPHVCVNATHPGLLPEVTDALSGLTGRLAGVRNVPVRFEDLGRDPHEDEAQLPVLTPFGWGVVRGELTNPERYAWEAAHMLVRADCEGSPSSRRVRITDEAVLRWLAPDRLSRDLRRYFVKAARKSGDTEALARYRDEDEAYARLAAMTVEERRAWLGRWFATARDCAPDEREVPSL
ncbi:hypothetical protein ACWERY_24310 [Streptomyces sp. NPDC004082]|uniref:hypothetical protein n=1 Tax=Streptomyces sp. NPDC005301 TaxID=3156874 RepID=UPI0033A83970